MRSRPQMLDPIYVLVCEASQHLSDARVAIPSGFERATHPNPHIAQLITALIAAHVQSLGSNFTRTYRDNEPVDLCELQTWLSAFMERLYGMMITEISVKSDSDTVLVSEVFTSTTPAWVKGIDDASHDALECCECAVAVVRTLLDYLLEEQQIVPPAPEGSGSVVHGGP